MNSTDTCGVAPAVPDHRRDFENEWIRYAGHLPKRDGDGYAHGPIDLAWRFWKAARGVSESGNQTFRNQTLMVDKP